MTKEYHDNLLVLLTEIRGDIKLIKSTLARHDCSLADHELRLRANERFRWGSMAIAVVVGALGTWGFYKP